MMDVVSTNNKVASNDIPSLLIPIAGRQLLLPTVSVAEMLPYKTPHKVDGVQPSWFLGEVLWRGVKVPMFSYEAINGEAIPEVKGISQMAILNNTGSHDQLPFLCFPTQGIPRLSRVVPESIKENAELACRPYDEMNIIVGQDTATIPDITKLEQEVASLLSL